jgi:PhnB protein
MAAQPIPEGYHTLTPTLVIDGAAAAIDFYTKAFGARERGRMPGPNNTIAHAELEIGDSVIMLNDPFPQSTLRPPTDLGGTASGVMMYVEDVDAVVERAVDAGATITMEVEDQFWGDRFGQITDPFGHHWSIATHVEDVPPDEMEERAKRFMASMAS